MKYDFESFLQVKRERFPEVYAFCPFHDDRNPSFSANIKTGLWKCFAGCGSGHYLQFLRLTAEKAQFTHAKSQNTQKSKSGFVAVKTFEYFYSNLMGLQKLKVVRREDASGNKAFHQMVSDGAGGWNYGGTKELLLPYRFTDWQFTEEPLCIVEGEKCVEFLVKMGFKATTFAGGSNGWRSHYINKLVDRDIIVLPDRDEPGERFATQIYEAMLGASKCRVVSLLGLSKGGDVVDWIQNSIGSVEDLRRLIYE